MEDKIIETIEFIKPYLNSDGGDIEYVKCIDNVVYIKLYGACQACGYSDNTIEDFILRTIQNEVPEVKDVVIVDF